MWPRHNAAAMVRLLRLLAAPERRNQWRALLALLLVLISCLALVPEAPPRLSTGWDKSNHALAFAALGFCGVWALPAWPRAALALALLAYGGAIEIAQGFVPPRKGDAVDLLADGAGIALGLVLARYMAALAARRPPTS